MISDALDQLMGFDIYSVVSMTLAEDMTCPIYMELSL
jgi:hypothetical protein